MAAELEAATPRREKTIDIVASLGDALAEDMLTDTAPATGVPAQPQQSEAAPPPAPAAERTVPAPRPAEPAPPTADVRAAAMLPTKPADLEIEAEYDEVEETDRRATAERIVPATYRDRDDPGAPSALTVRPAVLRAEPDDDDDDDLSDFDDDDEPLPARVKQGRVRRPLNDALSGLATFLLLAGLLVLPFLTKPDSQGGGSSVLTAEPGIRTAPLDSTTVTAADGWVTLPASYASATIRGSSTVRVRVDGDVFTVPPGRIVRASRGGGPPIAVRVVRAPGAATVTRID